MQDSLFPEPPSPLAPPPAKKAGSKVMPATPLPEWSELAAALPPSLRLGTSSWTYPGWEGVVWQRDYPDSALSRHGLAAYARHPLLRAVSIDRTFYKPLEAVRLLQYAAQVPEDFRFTIKAPGMITDPMLRNEEGHAMRRNPYFLDAAHAAMVFVDPVLQGIGTRLGAMVFQISPLPPYWLERIPELVGRLHEFLRALPSLRERAPNGVIAVEVRDREWLTKEFVQALKDVGATYCLGLHAKMPRITEQLPILRELWPGPFVCRWNLNPVHGAFGYEDAQKKYEPYDKLQDPDPETRSELARVISGVTSAGQSAIVTISNKSEGSAPLSVIELARALRGVN
ncbi:MAG: DUF72 domain-containing protein [Pseudomonadota bacterium]